MTKKKGKYFLYFVIVLSFIGLGLRLLWLWKHSTAFTYDQGRDLLDLREMYLLGKLRLIGASTSLHGVFYGPFWYWLSLPFYIITGGNPLSTTFVVLGMSFITPIFAFWLIDDKKLGLILATIYIFSHSFFMNSIIALNTNPVVYIVPVLVILLSKFINTNEKKFLYLLMFLSGSLFHFEPIIGLFWIAVFVISIIGFKKVGEFLKTKKSVFFFGITMLPQIVFELRHNFLQTKAFLSLLLGQGDSLTKIYEPIGRLKDLQRIILDVFVNQTGGGHVFLGIVFVFLFLFCIKKIFSPDSLKNKNKPMGLIFLVTLIVFLFGFAIYPYALWPWYLSSLDALILSLVGLGLYYLFISSKKMLFISICLFFILLLVNVQRYFPWPLEQGFSPDTANLRTRLAVVDLIYNDSNGKGMAIFTFAPYVYDYPYQYLIWWRAKTKYHYLPEEYVYLTNQPAYVAAKEKADSLIEKRDSTCDYLIIEPFESQEKWFWDWRGRFPEAKKSWEIGETKVEKLCQ